MRRDAFEKRLGAEFDGVADRWLIASLWSGRWTARADEWLRRYLEKLAETWAVVRSTRDPDAVLGALHATMDGWLADLAAAAIPEIEKLAVQNKAEVHRYFVPLWVWHRLDATRWEMSRIQLKDESKRKIALDVDHAVAFALWQEKLASAGEAPDEEACVPVNGLGNCSLLEKSFNISKGKLPLASFLAQVHELKSGQVATAAWAAALDLEPPLLDPSAYDPDAVLASITRREQSMKRELVEYLQGKRPRRDL
jgi:hypothetical protein